LRFQLLGRLNGVFRISPQISRSVS
jgi:hypothetical protein